MTIGWTCRVIAPAVRLRGVSKRYGAEVVLDGVRLDVPGRRFFGLLGGPGAGKSTMLAIAGGQLRPDCGSVEIFGTDLLADRAAAEPLIGVLAGPLRDRITGRELLTTTGRLRGLREDLVWRRVEELLHALDLIEAADLPVSDHPAGLHGRIGLARALLHEPRVLFLDEPFAGVDAATGLRMRAALDRYVAAGGTVVLATADPDLAERLCDTVAILHAGRVLASGRLDRVRGDRPLAEVHRDLVRAASPLAGPSLCAVT